MRRSVQTIGWWLLPLSGQAILLHSCHSSVKTDRNRQHLSMMLQSRFAAGVGTLSGLFPT